MVVPEVVRVAQRQLQLNGKLFVRAVRDITDEQGTALVHPAINPAHWVAGHLLASRYEMLAAWSGQAGPFAFAAAYGAGKALTASTQYPPISALLEDWKAVAPQVEAAVLQLPLEVLDASAPYTLPTGEQTQRGLLAFWLQHESYHIGQLSVIHQLLGHGPIGYT